MFDKIQVNIAGGLDIPLPRMARVRQNFHSQPIDDVGLAVKQQIDRAEIAATIKPGAKIAIGVGSRGVANIAAATKAAVASIKNHGGEPFIFPAMGSHGGATVEGQTQVLANYGVTEEQVGAPVRATMDTVVVSHMANGTPIHMDRYAHEADGVVLINRVKPHTSFRGDIESGIVKMMTIGMGKINGATIYHSEHGMDRFAQALPEAATELMKHIPFLFGLGMVEDAYDNTAIIEAMTTDNLLEREKVLQARAKELMARLYFDDIDVLIIDRMGKEISGNGFDPNIAGRNSRGVVGFDRPQVTKVVVLDLSDETHGNATGVGLVDVIPLNLFNRIDFEYTYANVITSAYLDGAMIPIVMKTEQDAIRLAIKTVPRVKPENARIVHIRDTLALSEIEVSESMFDEVHQHENMELIGDHTEMSFDSDGRFKKV